jgi:hypothetical protein
MNCRVWSIAVAAAAVAGALSAIQPDAVAAQNPADVRLDRAGTLVRVYSGARSTEPAFTSTAVPVEGNVQRLRADGVLVIRTSGGVDVEVPKAGIQRVEFSTGKRGHPWWGVVIGAVVGGVPGAVYWSRECEGSCRLPGLEGFALGALYWGVVPGFVVGSLVRTHRWQDLPLGYLDTAVERRFPVPVELRVAPAPTGGVSLGIRVAFGG